MKRLSLAIILACCTLAVAAQEDGFRVNSLTIDLKNGFLVYEEKDDYYLYRIEMCYWNEADGKHKLFADNGYHQYQSCNEILQGYVQASENDPDDVS